MRKLVFLVKDSTLEVLKFISDNRGLEVSNFMKCLEKRGHNKKKSPLYTNIVREQSRLLKHVTTYHYLSNIIIWFLS